METRPRREGTTAGCPKITPHDRAGEQESVGRLSSTNRWAPLSILIFNGLNFAHIHVPLACAPDTFRVHKMQYRVSNGGAHAMTDTIRASHAFFFPVFDSEHYFKLYDGLIYSTSSPPPLYASACFSISPYRLRERAETREDRRE